MAGFKLDFFFFMYENTEVKNMNGFRVKHTFTFTAAGQLASFYTTVSGFSEKVMPLSTCPSGMHVLEIPGLTIGSDIEPSNDLLDYVIFIRKTGANSLDKRLHKHYRENVLLPFVETVHQKHDHFVPGTNVPERLTGVSYCEGDYAQMAVVTDEATMENNKALRIVLNKQSAARSGTEQAADLSKLFHFSRSMELSQQHQI
jgi:hypothetical protein